MSHPIFDLTGRRALVYVVDAPGRYRPIEVELDAS